MSDGSQTIFEQGRKIDVTPNGLYTTTVFIGSVEGLNEIEHMSRDKALLLEEAKKSERKALAKGHTVHDYLTQTSVWRERRPVMNPDRPGRYVFHEDGQRVRCEWVEISMTADGVESRRVLRRTWVKFDNL